MSLFEQWWLEIAPGARAGTLNFWQNIYKEIYVNIIQENRWLEYVKGLGVTLEVSFFAILVGIVLGTLLALLRLPMATEITLADKKPLAKLGALVVRGLSKLAYGYIQLIRGTPLLLQVMIINFGIFGTIRIDKVIVGVIACGLNSAAYVAEIVRGGIQSVEKGQTEAGRSLGLSGFKTLLLIVLPQAAKSALPAMCNEFIALIKETSVLAFIALTDLTKAADYIRSRTYSAFTPYIVSALLYLAMVLILTTLISKLERRLRKGDRH